MRNGTLHRPVTNRQVRARLRQRAYAIVAAAEAWRHSQNAADAIGISLDQGEGEYNSAQYDAAMEAADDLLRDLGNAVDELLVERDRAKGE